MKVRGTIAVLVGAAVLLGSCAHAGYRVVVLNDSPTISLVRFSAGAEFADIVFESPSGVMGAARQGTGEFEGSVEFLTDNCEVVASTTLQAVGDVLMEVAPDLRVQSTKFDPQERVGLLTETDRCVRR